MQEAGRDSKPGCGARNVTKDGLWFLIIPGRVTAGGLIRFGTGRLKIG